MIRLILFSWGWQLKLVGSVALAGTFFSAPADSILAQIVPDNTLGAEGSVVIPNVNIQGIPSDRIEGGATRGTNLFHSLEEFNVQEGTGAYFAHPIGIENILTRVTGGNPSNIFGKLGVLGEANLFLLNPNGIVFGPNASLDIQGSFVATTAEQIQLGDSGYFSATQPQTSSLLSVSPGALFFSEIATQPTTIINQGNLSTGQHLTLSAGNLELQGQLQAGGNLTLQAQNTIKVRDSVTAPFLAQSSGNLTMIGTGGIDILAVNYPTQTPFFSGGNLSLISDGVIAGDSHFRSRGNFSIQTTSGGLANFVGSSNPVISALGDVDVAANYTGTSLFVEAAGNIRFQGDIRITSPDRADLSTSSTLIMRSGQESLADGDVNLGLVPALGTGVVPAGITINGNIILDPFNGVGGTVNLLAGTGDVTTQLISTNGQKEPLASDFPDVIATGGPIRIVAEEGSIFTGDLMSFSYAKYNNVEPGGEISLIAREGNITTGDLRAFSYSESGNVSGGGAIQFEASSGNITTGDLESRSQSVFGNAAQGGAIQLKTGSGNIRTGDLGSGSLSQSGDTSQGGSIQLETGSGSISTGDLGSGSKSDIGNADDGGTIQFEASNSIETGDLSSGSLAELGNAGDGGTIQLEAGNTITTGDLSSLSLAEPEDAGDGGRIQLKAGNSITTGNLQSFSLAELGNAGQGGVIQLEAGDSITTNDVESFSLAELGNAGQGGVIQLEAGGSITTGDLKSFSLAESGNQVQGGAIQLEAGGSIVTGDLLSWSQSDSGNGSLGGTIQLEAGGSISTKEVEAWSESESGDAGQGGLIQFEAGSHISTRDVESYSLSELGNASPGGAIQLETDFGNITTDDLLSFSLSESENASQGGSIQIETGTGNITTGNLESFSLAELGDAGQGGLIQIETGTGNITTDDLLSFSYSEPGNAGQGGAIQVETGTGSITTGGLESWSASTLGTTGEGGILGLTATNDIKINGNLNSFSYSTFANAGQGGAISIITTGGDISGQGNEPIILSSFSISEQGTAGNGGNVFLEARNQVSNLEILTLSSASQAGTVQVRSLADLLLTNTKILTSKQLTVPLAGFSNSITVDVGGEGQSGNVEITSLGNLSFNNSSIQADTKGSDPAGNITISSPGSVTFMNSQIISDTSNTGQAGSITINTPQVQLDVSSILSVQTNSSGRAGNLSLQPYGGGQALSVLFQDGGEISASTTNMGQGGNLFLTAPEAIAINGNGILSVEASGAGAGGNLTIYTQRLTIQGGAQVSASSISTNPNGIGGNITVNATQSLDINQASLLAQSNGDAPAGNVRINTGNLTATDAMITTSSEESSGGSITLTADQIRLYGNSDITTNVNQGGGGAGNISLKADSILAFNDSDILAFARDGQGGDITFDTPAFFGENYDSASPNRDPATLDNNNRVDVNATGAVSGAITLPDVSFIQNSLTELPENQINTDRLLANSCFVRQNEPSRGSFIITGSGGLPQRPGDAPISTFSTVDLETLPTDSTPSPPNPRRSWQKGDPIVEPQGLYRLPNGKLVLSRNCS